MQGEVHALLSRLRAGSHEALEELYESHVDGLYSFVFYRVGRDEALAEDVVQETFTCALDRLDQFDPGRGSFATWLSTLSRNVIRDQLRAHRKRQELIEMWDRIDETLAQVFAALEKAPLSDEVIARSETQDLVNMTIANLPENYREVLQLKYVEGETIERLAVQLAVSESAVKSLLARARRAFKQAFTTLCQNMAEVES